MDGRALLAGRYRAGRRLGSGAMGEVWQGFDQTLGRHVAVKLIQADLRDDAGVAGQALRRFRREAAAAARLNHRNITTVYDFGEHSYTDSDGRVRLVPFLVLEFLEGHDLGVLLEQAPVGLPVNQVLDWGIQACAGLAVAHQAGVVHRDIKPANLMLVSDGTLKICDFGIASLPDVTLGLTSYGVPMGTPGYMPPEQVHGRPVDHRADLYALGVTLHRLLTGRNRTSTPPGHHWARIGADLDDLLRALVAEDPDQRPASADEVAESLRTILRPASARSQALGDLPHPSSSEAHRDSSISSTRRETVASSESQQPWPVPRQLPAPSSVFVGRQDALTDLDSLLPENGEREAVVISAIAGGAGIGKTTLAVHWAHRIADHFPDGQLFVNLRGYDPAEPLTPLQALDGFLRALDVPATRIPDDLNSRSALFRSMLAGRRVLVVLDNAADADQVRPLIPGTAGSLALVTSRSQMAGLVTREGAHRVSLDILSPDQAVRLLRRTIGAGRVDSELDQTYALVQQCGYLPLALRIVAERAASHPHLQIADLIAELADERHRLDALAASGDPTTAVRTVFSWSYHRLPEPAAHAFRLLGLNKGPDISLHAAASLLDLPTNHTRTLLDVLTGQHLLQHSGSNRYRFHDLLRVYAAERADEDQAPELRDQAIRRLLTWYLETARAARDLFAPHSLLPPPKAASAGVSSLLSFTNADQALDWFEEERVNLVTATQCAADSRHKTVAWGLASTLTYFLFLKWYPDDWQTAVNAGFAAAQHQGDKAGQASMLMYKGERLAHLRRYRESIEFLERALPLSRQAGDRQTEGYSQSSLGQCHLELGELEKSMRYLQQALMTFQSVANLRGEGVALLHLGAVHLRLGQVDSSIDCNQRAVAIFAKTRNPDSRSYALRQLGEAYHKQQRIDKSIQCYEEALVILRGTGYQRELGVSLAELGELHLIIGQVGRGRQRLQEALAIFDLLGHPRANEIRVLLAGREPESGAPGP